MKADTCGCCELPASTPLLALNRPGLSAIAFRVGTYASFRQSMLQRIARMQALSALQTRSDDDYAITLLDMWATVADVLTFYQERIANEGYLRTARLRDSVLRMARLLDYQFARASRPRRCWLSPWIRRHPCGSPWASSTECPRR